MSQDDERCPPPSVLYSFPAFVCDVGDDEAQLELERLSSQAYPPLVGRHDVPSFPSLDYDMLMEFIKASPLYQSIQTSSSEPVRTYSPFPVSQDLFCDMDWQPDAQFHSLMSDQYGSPAFSPFPLSSGFANLLNEDGESFPAIVPGQSVIMMDEKSSTSSSYSSSSYASSSYSSSSSLVLGPSALGDDTYSLCNNVSQNCIGSMFTPTTAPIRVRISVKGDSSTVTILPQDSSNGLFGSAFIPFQE